MTSPKSITDSTNPIYFQNTEMIRYTATNYSKEFFFDLNDLILNDNLEERKWLNTYGLNFHTQHKQIIKHNKLDDFLTLLITEPDHRNKVLELGNSFFLSIKTLHFQENNFYTEQMLFVVSSNFVWSIQEKKGDYFGDIRNRLENNKGIVRNKKTGYLLYLIIEAIIDSYCNVYENLSSKSLDDLNTKTLSSNPQYVETIEKSKQNLFILKKAIATLRDAVIKLEKIEILSYESQYFVELKEQANYMIDDIDFDLQQLESNLNLIFNMQSHKLNEVMKTLTIFSVIFIPLTFIAGIYGMNFKNIPELNTDYGYFIVIAVMLLITLTSVLFFKKKKWF